MSGGTIRGSCRWATAPFMPRLKEELTDRSGRVVGEVRVSRKRQVRRGGSVTRA